MPITKSEKLFEHFCKAEGYQFERIPKSRRKSPDYYLYVKDNRIVIEVKELSESPNQQLGSSDPDEPAVVDLTSNRIRKLINKAYKQLQGLTEVIPGVLLLYNNNPFNAYIFDSTDIREAMYGVDTVYFSLDGKTGKAAWIVNKYGGKRTVTEEDKRKLSAIGTIRKLPNENLHINLYHNVFTNHPIKYDWFADNPHIRQFTIDRDQYPNLVDWIEIS